MGHGIKSVCDCALIDSDFGGASGCAFGLKRLLSLRHALSLSNLASGFVSSTATVASLGLQVRAGTAPAKANAGGALFSCVATLLQFVVIAIGSNIAWLKVLALPIIAGSLLGILWGLWLLRTDKSTPQINNATAPTQPQDNRMFSLKEAALVALALTVIQVLIYGLGQLIGDTGLLAGTLLASIFRIHAAMAAVFVQGAPSLIFAQHVECLTGIRHDPSYHF